MEYRACGMKITPQMLTNPLPYFNSMCKEVGKEPSAEFFEKFKSIMTIYQQSYGDNTFIYLYYSPSDNAVRYGDKPSRSHKLLVFPMDTMIGGELI